MAPPRKRKRVKTVTVEFDMSSDEEDENSVNVVKILKEIDLRKRLEDATRAHTGHTPESWQTDVAVASITGRDCMLISPTGSGKTLSFVMPCFVCPDVTVIIVSPLNALEENQVSDFPALLVPQPSKIHFRWKRSRSGA